MTDAPEDPDEDITETDAPAIMRPRTWESTYAHLHRFVVVRWYGDERDEL